MELETFRSGIRAQFASAFAVHRRTLALLEPAVGRARTHTSEVALALDMLFVQGYKTHVSVEVLAEYGHLEDTATLTRRLLELAAIAGHFAAAPSTEAATERCRRYLADLWHDLPEGGRNQLPLELRSLWEGYTVGSRRGAIPSFQAIFAELGYHQTYAEDYSLLARMAHGSSSDQVLAYAQQPVDVRATWNLDALLVFASRYFLIIAVAWNDTFHLIEDAALTPIVSELAGWQRPTE